MTAADAKALKASVLQAYSRAFVGDEGGRWVHGNARGPNIFVRLASTASNAVAATTTADTAAHASDCAVDTSAAAPTDAAAASPALPADSAGTDVMFIDFEFAGREGVARYPFDLDHRSFEPVTALLTMRRHAPAAGQAQQELGGKPILQAYDQALIKGSITADHEWAQVDFRVSVQQACVDEAGQATGASMLAHVHSSRCCPGVQIIVLDEDDVLAEAAPPAKRARIESTGE